jgi:hypothetical protein
MNKEKKFEIEIAKEYGQELVDKIKLLPDETNLNINGHKDGKKQF